MDFTHLCEHGSKDEILATATAHYKDLPAAEERLKALPKAFKKLGEDILAGGILLSYFLRMHERRSHSYGLESYRNCYPEEVPCRESTTGENEVFER